MSNSYYGVEETSLTEKFTNCYNEIDAKGLRTTSLGISGIMDRTIFGKQLAEKMSGIWKVCALISSSDTSFSAKRDEYRKILAKRVAELVDFQETIFDYVTGTDEHLDKTVQLLSESVEKTANPEYSRKALKKLKSSTKEEAKSIIGGSWDFLRPITTGSDYSACVIVGNEADNSIDIDADYTKLMKNINANDQKTLEELDKKAKDYSFTASRIDSSDRKLSQELRVIASMAKYLDDNKTKSVSRK